MSDNYSTTTLILAGGKGSRLGHQDKGLLSLNGEPLISYSVARADGECIAAINRNAQRYAQYVDRYLLDSDPYAGPMTAIWYAAKQIHSDYIVVLPCDAPLLPTDITPRLLQPLSSQHCRASFASHNGNGHYCCMAANTKALQAISTAPRSMRALLQSLDAQAVEFSGAPEQFLNINTADDLRTAATLLST